MPSEQKPDWRMWVISALATLLMLFGGFYLDSIDSTLAALRADQNTVFQNLNSHSERITTLEESKRNSETLLREIKSDLEEIKRNIARER